MGYVPVSFREGIPTAFYPPGILSLPSKPGSLIALALPSKVLNPKAFLSVVSRKSEINWALRDGVGIQRITDSSCSKGWESLGCFSNFKREVVEK